MNMGCVWRSKCGGTILGFGFAVFELKTLFFPSQGSPGLPGLKGESGEAGPQVRDIKTQNIDFKIFF